jgi:predicted GH43/DUF377 family glycosyl hydrolase
MRMFGAWTMEKRRNNGASLLAAVILLTPAMLSLSPALFSTDAGALSSTALPTLWLKYSGNPVIAPGPAGAFDSRAVFSSSVLRADGKYFLYYTGDSGSGVCIGLATSYDGRTFLKYAANPIINSGANASVLRDGVNFKMWYVGPNGACLATSDDGRVWTEYASNPVLWNYQPPGWDATILSINVLLDADVYKMWYAASDGGIVRIGHATSSDGVRWTKYAETPVLSEDASWESAGLRSPCVLRVSGEYQMWYSASDDRSNRICYANSTDGINWTKSPQNPLMPASSPWETPHNLCPAVLYDGRDYRLWYTGANSAWRAQIGEADSTGAGPFAPVPQLPAGNAWTNDSSPAFEWSFGTGGSDQSAYRLQLDDALDFSTTLTDTGMIPSADRTFALAGSLPDGTYYWRVMAWDAAGDESAWSAIWAFKIDTTSPGILTFVIDGGAAFTVDPTLRLSINASDPSPGSGLSEVHYYVNGSDWTPWEPYTSDLTVDVPLADRLWSVTVELRDRVNNTSPPANASILMDTTPPPAPGLRINDGASYTNNRSVELTISASDPAPGTGPAEMSFSNDNATWTSWEPYAAGRPYNLTPGDGPKSVQARIRDRAGNIGPSAGASIILDTTPPATTLVRIPALSGETNFSVSWLAIDALSGVGGFDVEYREDDGNWTAWLSGTNLTTAAFSGQDGSAYTFRARSFDRVGNVEPFAANVTLTVRVVLPAPVVAIQDPEPQKIIKGKYLAGGTSAHTKAGKTVTLVEVSIDGGPWSAASGTLSWTFSFDTARLKNGMHNLTARSFDGVKYSETAVVAFKVSNAPASTGPDFTPMFIIVTMIVIVGGVASVLVFRGRGSKPPARPPPPDPPDG